MRRSASASPPGSARGRRSPGRAAGVRPTSPVHLPRRPRQRRPRADQPARGRARGHPRGPPARQQRPHGGCVGGADRAPAGPGVQDETSPAGLNVAARCRRRTRTASAVTAFAASTDAIGPYCGRPRPRAVRAGEIAEHDVRGASRRPRSTPPSDLDRLCHSGIRGRRQDRRGRSRAATMHGRRVGGESAARHTTSGVPRRG